MKTIFKYECLDDSGEFFIDMPKDASILSIESQNNKPCMWAAVDTERKKVTRKFRTIVTGEKVDNPENLGYIGTVLLYDGQHVIHVFEVIPV